MSLSWFAWLRLQLWMFVMRLGVRFIFMRSLKSKRSILPASYSVEPNRVIRVPSTKDPRRTILVHVFYPPGYDPASTLKPLPVHLNVHGSGFMWNTFTADSEFAAYIALKAGCIVLDTDYAKAPEHRFPGGYNDVCDVVAYILSQPSEWDVTRFTMSGSSSGGALALAVCANQACGLIKSVIAMSPVVDCSLHPSGNYLVPDIPKGNPGLPLPLWERQLIMEAYLPDGVDREDPRLSPVYAPGEAFPPVTIICGDCDPLLPSIQRLVAKLRKSGNDVEEMLVEGTGHGWMRFVTPDSPFVQARDEAHELMIYRIQQSWKA